MNAFDKNNAYDSAATAYDYSEDRLGDFSSSPTESFDRAFYIGGREDAAPSRIQTVEREIPVEKRTAETKDIEPSPTTMQFLGRKNVMEDYREEPAAYSERKFKINAKAKVFIVVYALVIATIFALIILNTTLLKSIDRTVAAKQAEITALQTETEELRMTLDYVSDDAVIEQKAAARGMIKR